jgi:sugar transferase (PEP-CTERM/EpsH1 system associated)
MEILLLAHRVPFPPDRGDKIRSHRWLTALARRHEVHLGCFIDDQEDRRHLGQLRELCASMHAVPLPRWKKSLRALKGLSEGRSVTETAYRDRDLARWAAQRLATRRIGCVLAFSSAMAGFAGPPGATQRRIIDFVDVDSEKWRLASLSAARPKAWIWRREAQRLLEHDRLALKTFDLGVFISAAEAERFRSLAPEAAGRLAVLRNGVDTDFFDPDRRYPKPYGESGPVVALTGVMDYWPNEEAAIWFAREVLPWLRVHDPAIRFAVIGRRPSRRVRRLARIPGVRVIGGVEDIRPYLAHATAVVAPMRASIGVPNKILEAMAMARPVIASPQAVRGLDLDADQDLMVESDAGGFAAAVREAIAGGEAIEAIARQGRKRVMAHHDWDRVERRMLAIVEGPGQSDRAPTLRQEAFG